MSEKPNISARSMNALDWAIREAASWLGTYDVDSEERKEHASRLKEARTALSEVRTVRKAISQGGLK